MILCFDNYYNINFNHLIHPEFQPPALKQNICYSESYLLCQNVPPFTSAIILPSLFFLIQKPQGENNSRALFLLLNALPWWVI